MKAPIDYRKGIPLFHKKSKVEYRSDVYERYDPMVLRQTNLHLIDENWHSYIGHIVLKLMNEELSFIPSRIADIGCGIGRWIADLTIKFPEAECWGIDYSYQMLKQANDYWVRSIDIEINLVHQGFPVINLQGTQLSNLNFGLAKANNLPFDSESIDLLVSSFLMDRLQDPIAFFKEAYRVMTDNSRMMIITPFNFNNAQRWEEYYPSNKLREAIERQGFKIEYWQEKITAKEQLDFHGNIILWKCLAFIVSKH